MRNNWKRWLRHASGAMLLGIGLSTSVNASQVYGWTTSFEDYTATAAPINPASYGNLGGQFNWYQTPSGPMGGDVVSNAGLGAPAFLGNQAVRLYMKDNGLVGIDQSLLTPTRPPTGIPGSQVGPYNVSPTSTPPSADNAVSSFWFMIPTDTANLGDRDQFFQADFTSAGSRMSQVRVGRDSGSIRVILGEGDVTYDSATNTTTGFDDINVATGLSAGSWYRVDMSLQFNVGNGPNGLNQSGTVYSPANVLTVSVYNSSLNLLGTASGADWSLDWSLPSPYPSFGANFGARSVTGVNFTKRQGDLPNGTLLAYIDGVYPVPEPSSLALLALGAVGLFRIARRRRA